MPTNSAQTQDPNINKGARELASTFLQNGPTQVGGMVTSVILVGQAFSQLSQTIAPYIAFIFSCLIATYQVLMVQKTTAKQSIIVIPTAALIIFAMALGSNNSIAPSLGNSAATNKDNYVEKQLQLRDKELENANNLIKELQKILNLPTSPSALREKIYDESNDLAQTNEIQRLKRVFGSLVGEAYAQTSGNQEAARQEAMEALRAYKAKQKELQQEQQKLHDKEQHPKDQEQNKQPTPLWRKW